MNTTEWILIITIHTMSAKAAISNIETELLDGFTSEKTCLVASKKIGEKISMQSLNHLAVEGIELDGRQGKLAVFTDCQKIEK